MIIRKAGPEDFSAIFSLVSRWHDGTLLPMFEVKASMTWLTKTMSNGCVFVAEHEGVIIGSISGSGMLLPWNDSVWILNCQWMYVEPESRGGGTTTALITRLKEFVDEHSTPLIISINEGHDTGLKDRFMKICGFEYLGGTFAYGF